MPPNSPPPENPNSLVSLLCVVGQSQRRVLRAVASRRFASFDALVRASGQGTAFSSSAVLTLIDLKLLRETSAGVRIDEAALVGLTLRAVASLED